MVSEIDGDKAALPPKDGWALAPDRCRDTFYVGIGIVVSYYSNAITQVALNGPAYKADLRVGDILLNGMIYFSTN